MPVVTADSYGIAFDGSVDVTAALVAAINAQPPGTTFTLHPDGKYLCNTTTGQTWNAPGVTVDGLGATIFTNVYRAGLGTLDSRTINLIGNGMMVRNLRMNGFRKDTYNGSTLATVTGSPTVSGTTILLDGLNEAVRLPQVGLDWSIPPLVGVFMNYETPFYFRDENDLVKFEAVLSDTTHVANDCVFSIVDDGTSAVLASLTLTLTSTPTTYLLTFDPAAVLRSRFRIQVKKATATANVITVASISPYNEAGFRNRDAAGYTGGSEFSHGFKWGDNSVGITVQDCWVEGTDGDGYNIGYTGSVASIPGPTDAIVRRSGVRGVGRQGVVVEKSTNTLAEDLEIWEIGRSGFDFESNFANGTINGGTVRRCVFGNIRNAAFAMANWARQFNIVISDITSNSAGMGGLTGGAQGMTVSNFTHLSTTRTEADRVANGGKAGADFICYGTNIAGNNIITDIGFWLLTKTNTYDPGTGVQTYTPDNIDLANVSALNPTLTPPWVIETTNSSVSPPSEVVWGSTVSTWGDPDVTWGGGFVTDLAIVDMQAATTFIAEATLTTTTVEALMQAITTLVADGVLVHKGETTMQVAVSFAADADLVVPGQHEGETTMQAVVSFSAEEGTPHEGECVMQVAATFDADATLGNVPIAHQAELILQLAAYLLADGDVHQPPTGEWYLRGGSAYPPPLNRRKQLQGARQGTGRRIG